MSRERELLKRLVGWMDYMGGFDSQVWKDAEQFLNSTPDAEPSKPKIVIVMDGGIIQDILGNSPVEIAVIDYDVEGTDEDRLTRIPQLGGGTEPAYCWMESVTGTEVCGNQSGAERTNELFSVVEVWSEIPEAE